MIYFHDTKNRIISSNKEWNCKYLHFHLLYKHVENVDHHNPMQMFETRFLTIYQLFQRDLCGHEYSKYFNE